MPIVSILIPTFARAEFLRALLARLATEIAMCPAGSVEVVVSDNASEDHTCDVLERASAIYPWLRYTRPPQHLLSAEENIFHGLGACSGSFVWGIGDDDDPVTGALRRLVERLLRPDPPKFMIFNLSTMNAAGIQTRSRLLAMNAAEQAWSIERIIAAAGLMGLGACVTAVVAHRETLASAPWSILLERSPIYSHVIAYLEAFRGADCRLIDEPLACARQGATGLDEFARFAGAGGRYVYWPWSIGLPRHLSSLIARGMVAPDFATRIVEPQQAGPMRLMPYVLRTASQQLQLYIDHGAPLHAFAESDLDALTIISAAGPRSEREVVRELCVLGRLANSLHGAPDAPSAVAALAALSTAERRALAEEAGESAPDALCAALLHESRNALPETISNPRTSLRCLLDDADAEVAQSLKDKIAALAISRIVAASAALTLGPLGPDLEILSGLTTATLGAFYIAYPHNRSFSPAEAENLRYADPKTAVDILVAASRTELEVQAAPLLAALDEAPRFDERFAGWRLGVWRGGQIAGPDGGDPAVGAIRTPGDRKGLRKEVLKLNRQSSPLWRTAAAAAAAASVDEVEHAKVRDAPWFDATWYEREYPQVADALRQGIFEDAAHHWLGLGGRMGLSPSPWFDADDYLADYPAVVEALESGLYTSPLHHYQAVGAWEGARPFAPFDPIHYLAIYEDAARAFAKGVTPLEHFLLVGLREDRKISPTFNPEGYMKANPDVAAAVMSGGLPSALLHYVRFGRAEGRNPGSPRR